MLPHYDTDATTTKIFITLWDEVFYSILAKVLFPVLLATVLTIVSTLQFSENL
jgi:hypothetical protein